VSSLAQFTALVAVLAVGCSSAKPRAQVPAAAPPKPEVKLAVLPAESDRFPRAAEAVTEELGKATISGIDRKELSAVSLEVVQLSIECVQATPSCYAEVGKSLGANRLLFAELSGRKKKLEVKVTFFNVDAMSPRTAQKTFKSEAAASAGVADLVAEATR
jgi:hypothetical protein